MTPDRQSWPWSLVDLSPDLVRPQSLSVDQSLSEERATRLVLLAQQLYTFWNTGEQKYLDAAVSRDFIDNTLPPGRPQGAAGPSLASTRFRAAMPDLSCELSEVLIVGDKITARLVFRGRFTGTFNGAEGTGQPVEFSAIDIQHADCEKMFEDWHIEDTQGLLAQLSAEPLA